MYMEDQNKICQSCGMPLKADSNKGGTNADHSMSETYCSFCYKDGKFLDEGITLEGKVEKNVQIAMTKMNMPENEARQMAMNIIPNLQRWK